MKTNLSSLQFLAVLSVATVVAGAVCSASGNRVDPATGFPVAAAQTGATIDPATGMPTSNIGERTAASAVNDAYQAAREVHALIFNSRYDEALRRCLAFHNTYKTSGSLIPLLSEWIELGRRYPEAKAALVQIRDRGVAEFAADRGYADLFSAINSINRALQEDAVTYELFTSFRDKDPQLAQQCYFFVEGLLVARGEYQWCYDHMGDAQGRFDSIRQHLTLQLEHQKRLATMSEASRQRMAEMQRQRGLKNVPAYSPPDPSAMMKQAAENYFVAQTRQLIEILVGTGHADVAARIRDQAISILADPRLQSAVTDAETKVQK